MKAVFVKEFGGIENLEIREVENPPKPRETEVLVNVKASALNRADLLQRKGFYPAPAGFPERILGLEFAGEAAETGEKVSKFKTGDRVFGITAGGAQAEFLLTDESLLAKIPENLSFTEAAAIPEAFITAHDAIFAQAKLKESETLLIHAVGSGVGLAALQLAKAQNIKTIGTSRTAEKLEECRKFGLDEAILTGEDDEFCRHYQRKNRRKRRRCDSRFGRRGLFSGKSGKPRAQRPNNARRHDRRRERAELNFGLVMSKRAKIIGTVLRARPTGEKAEATRAFAEKSCLYLKTV